MTHPSTSPNAPLEKAKLMAEHVPREVQLDALRTFGEIAQEERAAIQVQPLNNEHLLQCTVTAAPNIVKKGCPTLCDLGHTTRRTMHTAEFADLFPDRTKQMNENPLTIVTLAQKTVYDTRAWSAAMEVERDQLTKHVSFHYTISQLSLAFAACTVHRHGAGVVRGTTQ